MMEIKLHNPAAFEDIQSLTDTEKYFWFSISWSLIEEAHITFVRQAALAYCYNLKWAGPLTESVKLQISSLKEDDCGPFVTY
jgi:hypothetical protein